MRNTAAPLVLLGLALLLVGTGCGGEPKPTGDEPRATAPLPDLPAVSPAQKVRFALDRLLQGPLPRTGAFAVPKIHQLNLEHARADLVALGDATADLLSDPGLVERMTQPDGDHNPWHNVLQALAWLDGLPADLAVRWSGPVLATDDLQLDRRAARALVAVADGLAVAPLLLTLFERRPKDRELAPVAFRALVDLGSPWRERALDVALREGASLLWSRVPAFLQTAPGDDASGADALAWWAILAEVSGPGEARGTSRSVTAPWFQGRLLLDDAVWPRDALQLDAAVQAARVLAPASVIDAGGFLPDSAGGAPVLAWRRILLSGRGSAADARCRLADAGYETYRATVRRDLTAADPLLLLTAEGCAATRRGDDEALELDRIVLATFLEELESGSRPSSTGVAGALGAVFEASAGDGVDAALGILRHARPQGEYQGLIEAAHDALANADPAALRVEVTALLGSEDAGDRATGMLLARRGRDPALAPVLSARLAVVPPAEQDLLQRLLIWLHSAPEAADGPERAAFVQRFAAWLGTGSDADLRGLAPGLLDLGPAGAAAYAAGLAGPRRLLYVEGLLGRSGLVPLEVAAALLDPVDQTTSRAERHAVLVAAYRVAPTTAAPHVAALRARVAAGDRAEVDDVLAVVRHRAAR